MSADPAIRCARAVTPDPRRRRAVTAAAAALSAALLVGAAPAQAGRSCEARLPDASRVQRGIELAERTARALNATGAQVVVLARAGQDLSRWQLRWSHLGLAYRSGNGEAAAWRVVHKLNGCGSGEAALYRQGLGEFFLDDPHEFRAAFAVPTTDLQARLLPVLRDNAAVARMHISAYNMVAYPWAQRYQQSNQWLIETLAHVAEPAAINRERAQAWLQLKGYQPTVLRISPLVRLGARVSAAHIAFDDHPDNKRWNDRIETVSADSVFDWLAAASLAGAVQELR